MHAEKLFYLVWSWKEVKVNHPISQLGSRETVSQVNLKTFFDIIFQEHIVNNHHFNVRRFFSFMMENQWTCSIYDWNSLLTGIQDYRMIYSIVFAFIFIFCIICTILLPCINATPAFRISPWRQQFYTSWTITKWYLILFGTSWNSEFQSTLYVNCYHIAWNLGNNDKIRIW